MIPACLLVCGGLLIASPPAYQAELVFPLHAQHNHAPGIVETSNGDLIVSWYRGSGERSADDVAVYGSRRSKESDPWSEPFLMVDQPGFPDCNTCMMIDGQQRLWLFWPVVLANSWESCLTNYLVSSDYSGPGSPRWQERGIIPLKPDHLESEVSEQLDQDLERWRDRIPEPLVEEIRRARELMKQKIYLRLGWQPRCKPTVLPTGRILLPLYTDTFSMSLMAVSDDQGRSWYASKPMIGFGNIQPTVLRRDDGTLVAYMRENGLTDRIRVAHSTDDGITWSRVSETDLPNPGAGIDGIRLANGHWLLVYNDLTRGRHQLAVSISDDEGRTWKWTRHLEKHDSGAYHYPAVIQGVDGTIHAVYSYFVEGGKSMKHAAFNEAWVVQGD
jgi:predicted neuraminidase